LAFQDRPQELLRQQEDNAANARFVGSIGFAWNIHVHNLLCIIALRMMRSSSARLFPTFLASIWNDYSARGELSQAQ
jgi:hypothetical protein